MKTVFPVKRSGEVMSLEFDFTSQLATGETISTAVIDASVYTGGEVVPSLVAATPTISGSVVTSLVSGGLLGTIYGVTCQITTSLGQTLQQWGDLAIAPGTI